MPFLSLLGPVKNILLNPKVLIGIALVAVAGYVYMTITGLQKDLAVSEKNVIEIKNTNETNVNTIKKLNAQIKDLNSERVIVDKSYNKEIKNLKELIKSIEQKVIYKDKIVIKKVKVPVIKEGKKVYVDSCPEIQLHRLDFNETGILKTLSEIGK